MMKELLRGRAVLLVADRIDIVDAADADGVMLTSKGGGYDQLQDNVSNRNCLLLW